MEKIFIIWWWAEYSNYKDYHEYVSNIEFNPYEEKFIWWKDNLSKDLWDKFEVIKIPMPNKDFADYILELSINFAVIKLEFFSLNT